jgi:hypothetical protein
MVLKNKTPKGEGGMPKHKKELKNMKQIPNCNNFLERESLVVIDRRLLSCKNMMEREEGGEGKDKVREVKIVFTVNRQF